MKTYSAKPHEIEAKWYLIDAEGKTLGRLASLIADILRGKNDPRYTPHIDLGNYVIVINAEKIKVTGNKETDKFYHSHSGFPGGYKKISFKDMMAKHPTRALMKAVKGMLPHNRLGAAQLTKLKIYAGSEHPHQAQLPVVYKELEVIK